MLLVAKVRCRIWEVPIRIWVVPIVRCRIWEGACPRREKVSICEPTFCFRINMRESDRLTQTLRHQLSIYSNTKSRCLTSSYTREFLQVFFYYNQLASLKYILGGQRAISSSHQLIPCESVAKRRNWWWLNIFMVIERRGWVGMGNISWSNAGGLSWSNPIPGAGVVKLAMMGVPLGQKFVRIKMCVN